MSILKFNSIILLFFFLSGCGFHLRGQDASLSSIKALYLKTSDPYGPLTKTLISALKSAGAELIQTPEGAPYTLEIMKIEKTTQSIGFGFSNQVSMNTLTYSLSYQLLNRKGRELIPVRTLYSVRDFTINTNQALMGNVIPEYLLNDMRRDLANQLVDQLNAWELHENKLRSTPR